MLLDKLTAEKSHIAEWALEGLEELLGNNLIFTESDEACVFKSRYIAELNNVKEFVRDRCCIDLDNDECKVHRKVLFPAYKQYCRDNSYKSQSRQEFFVEVSKLNVKPGKMRINSSTPLEGLRGIRLLTNAVRYIRSHDLRHTSATLLINQGVHAKIISERLGHGNINTTMNVYGHALRSADQSAADKFETILLRKQGRK
ncbi:tyrosine-type recombinase/integrase [Paenibacillus alba]|uniref:tyrosine-type recombinase/integrase n=1 Tax=Paenibacillus alba TaxID=1197127 RepID=UPI00156446F6|nr:tyrosine-type recombinase/integrase [Paenibacillus alba]NQX71773.1 tyrosine-type recombinase/integrase [Paenibacillus alba]